MSLTRRQTLAALGAASVTLATPRILRAAPATKLVVGTQKASFSEIVKASGVLENLPFELEWAVPGGPANQLSAIYSKAIDVGSVGDTSTIIEQGRAKEDWTQETAPFQIIAGYNNPNPDYPQAVTVVRNDANIKTLADLRGKRWANNFGGYAYLQYVLSRIKAGLTVKDFQPVQLADQQATSAAFASGSADIYSGQLLGAVKELVDKGEATILVRGEEVDLPALSVFIARADVIQDEAKSKALEVFLDRIRQHWDWYENNLDKVEKIYIDTQKQRPDRAKYEVAYFAAKFRPIDEKLLATEQKIADVLFEAGDIPKKIDVSAGFATKYVKSTNP